jgi:copper(I)-binding protein
LNDELRFARRHRAFERHVRHAASNKRWVSRRVFINTDLEDTMIRNKIAGAGAILCTMLAFGVAEGHEFKVGQIEIGHPYSRAMLPVAKVGGGYMKLTNNGAADRLVSATSARAGSVEFHEMKMNGAIMEMRELDSGIALPAKSTVELKPGGYHVMFMNVTQPFKEGEMVKATLVFEKAGPVDVEFSVGPVAGEKGHGAHAEHGK